MFAALRQDREKQLTGKRLRNKSTDEIERLGRRQMIRTVIFDIGNVLMKFDYMPYIRTLLGDEETVYRVNGAIWRSGYWNDLDRGEDVDKVYPKMLEADPEFREEIRLAFENVGQCMFKMDYAIPWIRELKGRGYQVLYLSNYSRYAMQANPDVLDFLPYMDGGVFSCDVGVVKPDRAIYRTLCEKYALEPSECVFLDDFEDNVSAARAFGMSGIHFHNYEQAREELEQILMN